MQKLINKIRDIVSNRKRGRNMKKKSSVRKAMRSMVRTIIAIGIIAIGIAMMYKALHWPDWISNGDLAFALVTIMNGVAMLLIGYGIYLISPIYIGGNIYKLLEKCCEFSSLNEMEDDEEDDCFSEKLLRMKEKYLW